MELTGTHTFPAPQAVVWRVLTDPETLRRTLPGCQKFELQPDGGYQVTMTIGIAAIKGTYTGTVHMENEQPARLLHPEGGGQGRGGLRRWPRRFYTGPHRRGQRSRPCLPIPGRPGGRQDRRGRPAPDQSRGPDGRRAVFQSAGKGTRPPGRRHLDM